MKAYFGSGGDLYFVRLRSVLTALSLLVLLGTVPSQSAQAMNWSCSEFSTRYSIAIGKGDLGAAAQAQRALASCQSSGSGAAVASSVSGCTIYQDLYLKALASGDANTASIYKATYNDCVANTNAVLGNSNSGGGTGSGTPDKGCESAPNPPTLEVRYAPTGVWISVKIGNLGQKTEYINYAHIFLDSTTSEWGNWISQLGESRSSFSVLLKPPSSAHSSFGFEARSFNNCGMSAAVQTGNGYGLPTTGEVQKDKFTQAISTIRSDIINGKGAGWGTYLSQIGQSDSQRRCEKESEYHDTICNGETDFEWDLPTTPTAKSLTPSICAVSYARVTTKKSEGVCKLQIKTTGDAYAAPVTKIVTLKVVPMSKLNVVCYSGIYPNYKYKFFRGMEAQKLKNFKCPTGTKLYEIFHAY